MAGPVGEINRDYIEWRQIHLVVFLLLLLLVCLIKFCPLPGGAQQDVYKLTRVLIWCHTSEQRSASVSVLDSQKNKSVSPLPEVQAEGIWVLAGEGGYFAFLLAIR